LILTGVGKETVVAEAVDIDTDLIVRILPTLDRMELALAVADIAVARAGANTVHELAACAIPAILVPYPYATNDHQLANATELERAGAARIMLDRELSPEDLARRIEALVDDADVRSSMAVAAAAWATPDADTRLAALVRSVARS
jgi:UDP-N-acetylglucosamine--N-acetylmuramyl-(pentapeptide) pyrophosphoryl-undecaprenol N-acetylglucosamine transferase